MLRSKKRYQRSPRCFYCAVYRGEICRGPVFPDALKCVQFFDIEGFEDSNSNDIDNNPTIKELMEATIKHFGKYTALKLSRWSHLPGSPWFMASDGGATLFTILSDDDIKQYFRTKVLA